VLLPARWRFSDSADPRGRHRPADLQRQLDGRNLLAGRRPNLSNFYVPVQASIYGDDPRPEIAQLIERY
jgi:hypothetical protein